MKVSELTPLKNMNPNWYQTALNKLHLEEVTLWYRSHNGKLKFNHLESGHSTRSKPDPKFDSQKQAWGGGQWSKRLWYARRDEQGRLTVVPEL